MNGPFTPAMALACFVDETLKRHDNPAYVAMVLKASACLGNRSGSVGQIIDDELDAVSLPDLPDLAKQLEALTALTQSLHNRTLRRIKRLRRLMKEKTA